MTLTELCTELRNWFERTKYYDTFVIADGTINLSDMVADGSLQDGQYFRIVGSIFNDGVYQYVNDGQVEGLTDEIFRGAVWGMAVPPEVIVLKDDIENWVEKYGSSEAAQSPFQSESFGGYSYSLKGGASGSNGDTADAGTWQSQFNSRLSKWRKI